MNGLPCVVQLGFAGSRRLFDQSLYKDAKLIESLHEQLREQLWQAIDGVRGKYLEQHHMRCGISQVAIGADFLFSQICRDHNVPQRVFLPQARHEFLTATGSKGDDFNTQERQFAQGLLESAHVIQERVASSSDDRHERFEDANEEVLRACDIVICMLRDNVTEGGKGGTMHIMDLGKRRGKPVLVLRVGYDAETSRAVVTPSEFNFPTGRKLSEPDDRPVNSDGKSTASDEKPPRILLALPTELQITSDLNRAVVTAQEFCKFVRAHTSPRSRSRRLLFRWGASIIIWCHLFATCCAVVGKVILDQSSLAQQQGEIPTFTSWIFWLGVAELVLLLIGIGFHVVLHKRQTSLRWARNRLLSQVAYSVEAAQGIGRSLAYLFHVRLPVEFEPLLQTMNMLHLKSNNARNDPSKKFWQVRCEDYRKNRVEEQLAWYEKKTDEAKRSVGGVQVAFLVLASLAVVVTLINLFGSIDAAGTISNVLFVTGIVLPALAVGVLTISASLDTEARKMSYGDAAKFLRRHSRLLQTAASQNEFERLVEEAEAYMLAETAGWYIRRSTLGV